MTRWFCVDCGDAFFREVDETWKTRCIHCFKKMKRAEQPHCECLRLQNLVAELRAQLATRPVLDVDLMSELREMLPRLRQLCHPDRHDGSMAATKASQWLNAIRERLH